ncbi:MAG: ShlB/FhaC/HecB family hemolysin secretion/activation protein [Marinomonas sp.]
MEKAITLSRKFARYKRIGGLVIAAGLAMPSMVSAQAIGAPTREELQRQQVETDLRSDANSLSVASQIERAPCPLAAAQFADLKFTFSRADFSGLGGVDAAMLDPVWSEYIGQEIPVATICEIRDRAATLLRAKGYLAAVQVPEQQIGEGAVKFDAILARIKAVQVRGDAGNNAGMLGRYLAKLQGQPVFNANDAERYLLLARDIPGLDVRLTLQPLPADKGGAPGDVVGVFDVSNQPVIIDTNIQNFGSPAAGRFGGLVRMRGNGLTGLGDETMLSAYSAQDWDEQLVVSGHHEFRVGSEGLTFGVAGTMAYSEPDIPGPDLFRSETFVGSIYGRYPILRGQSQNLVVSAGGDFINQNVDFSGLDFSNDKLRVGYARIDYAGMDRNSINGVGGFSSIEPQHSYSVALEVRKGLDILGASPGCGVGFANCLVPGASIPSRLDGDPTGLVVRGETMATFRATPLFGVSAKARFQYSPDALLSYEQFSGGNYTIGRGYDPGAIIGDNGIGVQFEAFYGSLVPATPDEAAVQPFIFLDIARVSLNNVANDFDRLTSGGAGMRMSIGRQAVLDVIGAVPFVQTNLATNKGSARVLMSLTVQLAPWFK